MNAYGPVVISGASGMIGAPLARRCLADGLEVHLLTRSPGIPPRLIPLVPNAHVHQIDWDDSSALRSLLNSIEPRTLFHLAGTRFTSPGESIAAHLESAVGVSGRLIHALSDLPNSAIVYASSGAVYGARVGAPESTPAEPASWLGTAKVMAEALFAAEARIHGRPVVTLRLFTPFGPDDEPDRLIVSVLRAVADGVPLALTTGNQTRDYVFIDDVVDAFVRAALLRPERPDVFNIGSGQARSIRSIVEWILTRADRLQLAQFGARPDRPGEIEAMQAHRERAAERLGWSPRFSFADGIEQTIARRSYEFGHAKLSAELERMSSR